MTNTVDIQVDGDSIDIEVDELSPVSQMLWAGKAPEGIKVEEAEEVEVTEEMVQFLIDLTTSQTILTRELLEELPQEELSRLFSGVVLYAFDGDRELLERGADKYRMDEGPDIEFNDDGSIDLDDWQ